MPTLERFRLINSALIDFLARLDRQQGIRARSLAEGEGEVAGISYQIRGSGPPLVLLPLGLAPSQWEPLLPTLSQQYCTITLGGAELGAAAGLETWGRTPVCLRMVRTVMDEVHLQPGATVLDVGCGTGILDRWLARRTGGANPILAVDINRYLLREATVLARKEGLAGTIEFREGSAEALPFFFTIRSVLSCLRCSARRKSRSGMRPWLRPRLREPS